MKRTLLLIKTPKTDHQYPTLLKQCQANYIDRIITYGLIWAFINVAISVNSESLALKAVAVFIALSYEPLLVTFGRTLGQLVIGIRVKQLSMDERIPLLNAFGRFWLRMVLGWFTFLTIHNNEEHRAMHDLATGAVVVEL